MKDEETKEEYIKTKPRDKEGNDKKKEKQDGGKKEEERKEKDIKTTICRKKRK